MKIEWRKFFPISWYRWEKGYDFNIFAFWLDCMLYITPLTIVIINISLK